MCRERERERERERARERVRHTHNTHAHTHIHTHPHTYTHITYRARENLIIKLNGDRLTYVLTASGAPARLVLLCNTPAAALRTPASPASLCRPPKKRSPPRAPVHVDLAVFAARYALPFARWQFAPAVIPAFGIEAHPHASGARAAALPLVFPFRTDSLMWQVGKEGGAAWCVYGNSQKKVLKNPVECVP